MANKTHIGIGSVVALLIAAYFGLDLSQSDPSFTSKEVSASQQRHESEVQQTLAPATSNHQKNTDTVTKDDLAKIQQAFERQQSDVQVQSVGTVKAVLRDDNEGSRHQKFILKLNNGQTVLVAHNIDLSPRIDDLQKDDSVEFYGEYEYSAQGGVIHWTHHDPNGRHVDGWLKHQGKTYQ
jgi:gas vesicle protein